MKKILIGLVLLLIVFAGYGYNQFFLEKETEFVTQTDVFQPEEEDIFLQEDIVEYADEEVEETTLIDKEVDKEIEIIQDVSLEKDLKDIPEEKKEKKENVVKNDAKLLFASGFEAGVSLLPAVYDEGGIWWQDLVGGDVPGYFWPASLQGKQGVLQLIVDYDEDIDRYIQNRIVKTLDGAGMPTKALHQNIIKKQQEDTQDPFIIYTEDSEVEDLYISYSLKYPENLMDILGDDGWAVLTEFKTTGDYRLALYVYEENGELYWYMHGDNVVIDDSPYKEYWFIENHSIPVPTGKWFDVEIAWHRSINDSGWVDWKVNNQTVSHYKGPTKLKDPINAVMVFTNYASGPLEQWIDNVEIWDKVPTR
jgi:hypothetical protein